MGKVEALKDELGDLGELNDELDVKLENELVNLDELEDVLGKLGELKDALGKLDELKDELDELGMLGELKDGLDGLLSWMMRWVSSVI